MFMAGGELSGGGQGEYASLPSSSDLLVSRRLRPLGNIAERPRVVISGDLSGIAILDLVAFLHQSRTTGVLTVNGCDGERQISLKEGDVHGVRSSIPGERLGEIVVKLGYADEATVSHVLGRPTPIGRALVDAGVITANDLWRCLHEQIAVVFHGVSTAHRGAFWLIDEAVSDVPGASLAVSTQGLLMDAARRVDEMAAFRRRIPNANTRVRRKAGAAATSLEPAEEALFGSVQGTISIAELSLRAHRSEFDVTKGVHRLLDAGYVEVVQAQVPADPKSRLGSIVDGMNCLLTTVIEAVPAAHRERFLGAVRSHLSDPSAPLPCLAGPFDIEPDGTLASDAIVEAISMRTKSEAAVTESRVLDALRELAFFYVFIAGEGLDPAAEEALASEVRTSLRWFESVFGR